MSNPTASLAHYGDDERPWLKDRHHPLLGRHLPHVLVPDWPDMVVEPAYSKDKVLPHAFKAYTRVGGDVVCDAGKTYEESKYRLRVFVENRNG